MIFKLWEQQASWEEGTNDLRVTGALSTSKQLRTAVQQPRGNTNVDGGSVSIDSNRLPRDGRWLTLPGGPGLPS